MGKSGILPAEDPEEVVVGLLEPLEYLSENRSWPGGLMWPSSHRFCSDD